MTEKLALLADVLILVWLIGTWFYEGHHRRCKVDMICSRCDEKATHDCKAGKP